MRVRIDGRRFRVDIRVGGDVHDDPPPEPDVQLDAFVEQGAPDPHPRSELDGRRPIGFAAWRKPSAGGYSAVGPAPIVKPPPPPGPGAG